MNEPQDMETDQELLPSILYARFNDNAEDVSLIDHESLLLELLSLLSTLEDITPYLNSRDTNHGSDCDLVTWIFKRILQESTTTNDSDAGNGIQHEQDSLLHEWSMALRYIHDLVQHIAPVELHFLASQSIVLSQGASRSHRVLCLLLCAHSLRQCPLLLQKRWKRWQSLVCETLRIFQDSIPLLEDTNDANLDVDTEMATFPILIHHIIPSCIHVMDQLPLEISYHVAIFSGLVGTTCNLLERVACRCQEELSKGTKHTERALSHFQESLCIAYGNVLSIIQSFDRFGGISEHTLWVDPMLQPVDMGIHRHEDVDFWMHRENLSWWVHHRRSHEPEERIANMDTSVHKTGLGLLAMKAFQERPLVYHPNYVWTIWFPHVVTLFSESAGYPYIVQSLAPRFLESLIEIIHKESLVLEKTICSTPDAHLEIFHLLSNQLMSRVQKTTSIEGDKTTEGSHNNSFDEEADFRERSQRTVGLIRNLLTRFTTGSQVKIIEKVMENCPSPGLKARFLDLLRPLILIPDSQTEKMLWTILKSILDDLFKKYWNQKEQILISIEGLINRDVEISVGAITMIQMWSLVKGKNFYDDPKVLLENLGAFRVALQKLLSRWSEDTALAPKSHYRLFLLDSALENTCQSLMEYGRDLGTTRAHTVN